MNRKVHLIQSYDRNLSMIHEEKTLQVIKQENRFPVVGIGVSSDDLDSFKKFFSAVPINSGMAFIVAHAESIHERIISEIGRMTQVPFVEITNEVKPEPNHIYLIPPNKTLTSAEGNLKLSAQNKMQPNLGIDVFFKSLAEIHQNYAVAIVLSGIGSDASTGLKAIKANGGITFGQNGESSGNTGTSGNSVPTHVVDFILPPEEIPGQLLQVNRTYKSSYLDSASTLTAEDEAIFDQILSLLGLRSGVDFTYYKQATIRRRLTRRMALSGKENLSDYLNLLQQDKSELSVLFNDVLIPVTSFFRDPKTYQSLNESVFPAILKNKSVTDPIRIWSAACSSGEEAYSLAISIHEFLDRESISRQVQIFGSDISEQAISKARSGIYIQSEIKNISEERLANYFTKNNNTYQVKSQIRDLCVFAVHNFLKDPPFNKMDLISCRNVLIYLDPFLQKKALSTFHYSLKDSGFLLLGKSETAGTASELFTPFEKPYRIFSRKPAPGRFTPVSIVNKNKDGADAKKITLKKNPETDFKKSAENILLANYTPANVIINEHMDIVHINGSISPFLEPSPGKPTFNLIKMARGSLGFELRNALQKAKASNTSIIKEGIPVEHLGKSLLTKIEVLPLKDLVEPHYLVLFRTALNPLNDEANNKGREPINDIALARIEQLEKELAEARADMLTITQEQESLNEELQNANEELLSGTEELQSLNEELETTLGEMQSANKDLITANHGLLEKQEQLDRDRLFAEAIIKTLREPFVILDKDLRVRTAADSFYKKFNTTTAETEGRLFYEISDGQWNDDFLRSILEKIFIKKTTLDDFEFAINFPVIGWCTMLLNARRIISEKTEEDLIVLTIDDITEKKIADERNKRFAEELELKVKERTLALEKTNLQLEQFSHTASHEFQEPLRKIVTFSKYLQQWRDNSVTPEIKNYLNKIESASTRMSKLIQDMLNFAGVSSNIKLFEKTDLNKILKDILFDFELLISEKKVQITSDELPEMEAVPFQMNQLFYDLISNAIKFSKPNGPVLIHIEAQKLSREQTRKYVNLDPKLKYYQLIFKDNGIGFDQKYAQQIFSMFQRLHETGTYSGTGIGLALCKKIVQNYHGEIFAEGKENEGAAFHVILPVKQPPTILELPF